MGIIDFSEIDLKRGALADADMLVGNNAINGISDPHLVLSGAVDLKNNLSRLEGTLGKAGCIGLVLNDCNRPTPTALILDHIRETHPGLMERVKKVHIATGAHKPPTEDDLRAILGPSRSFLRKKVHIHEAKDEKAHGHICTTELGTDVRIDRALADQDALLFINSVEPHYFAGYTGGRKSVLPGMAAYSTVEQNHSHALSPGSKILGLEGNPVHEDIEDAVGHYLKDREHLSVQVVQGIGKTLTSVHSGDIFSSFREAVKAANGQFCIPVKGTYDIVVSVAKPPMDRTLYQAQKALESGKLALRDGGVIMLVAGCSEGIGQSTFWDLITSNPDRESALKRIFDGYVLGYHKAAKLIQLSQRAHILAVSGIRKDILEKGFITGFNDLGSAMTSAMKIVGRGPRVLVIPDGTMTVPMVG